MTGAKDLWDTADKIGSSSDANSSDAMRMYALGMMLAEAETAVLTHRPADAASHLAELRAYTEKMISVLQAPLHSQSLPRRPRLALREAGHALPGPRASFTAKQRRSPRKGG